MCARRLRSVMRNFYSLLHNSRAFEYLFLIILATVHGYGAAWLAVRMLFRPRYPIKLFGVTIFPQGMIPRHRQRLAESIGRAVGGELVSQETVVHALFGEDFFRRKVERFVNEYAESLLNASYPSLVEALPARIRPSVLDAIASLQRKLAERIAEVLRSDETREAVRQFVSARLDELLARRLSEAIDDKLFEEILGFAEGRLRETVGAPNFEKRLRDFVSARLDEILASRTPLNELFTPDAVALVKSRLEAQVEPIVHELAAIATSQRTRSQIGALIKREVDDYYEQLSFFKKIFISRERISREVDDLVNKTLPRRVEEFMHGEAFAEEARAFLDSTIDGVLQRTVSDLVGQIAPEKLQVIKDEISARLLALARSPELAETFNGYLREALARLRPHSLRALMQHIQPDSAARAKRLLSDGLASLLAREETAQAINGAIGAQIERLLIKPIGRPADFISPATVEAASRALTERITQSAQERLPAAIGEFDIGGIVRRKVAEYPVEKLEELVLSISKQHLRTIELFGLFMGLGIGVVQVLILWLGPSVARWLGFQ